MVKQGLMLFEAWEMRTFAVLDLPLAAWGTCGARMLLLPTIKG